MKIWDGNLHDTTNYEGTGFLQINSCGIEKPNPGYTIIRRNGRKDWLLILVSDGTCRVLRAGEEYDVSPGSAVIFAPNEPQQYGYPDKCTALWLHFTGTAVSELLDSCGLHKGLNRLCQSKQALEAFTETIRRFHTPGRESYANASLLELLYSLSDAASDPSTSSDRESGILSAVTYINTNYNMPITLEGLAKISGYSKSRFSHLFAEIIGTTPIKYQNGIRLRVACEMLTGSKLSVSDIAYSCGFSDPLYFSKLFKKAHGTSPSDYRTKISKQATKNGRSNK